MVSISNKKHIFKAEKKSNYYKFAILESKIKSLDLIEFPKIGINQCFFFVNLNFEAIVPNLALFDKKE